MLKSCRLIRFLGILLDPTVRIPLTWPLGKYGLPIWQNQDVQTEVFGTRAGDTTTLKIKTQAIIGQTPTIWRDMLAKVTWSKSSV